MNTVPYVDSVCVRESTWQTQYIVQVRLCVCTICWQRVSDPNSSKAMHSVFVTGGESFGVTTHNPPVSRYSDSRSNTTPYVSRNASCEGNPSCVLLSRYPMRSLRPATEIIRRGGKRTWRECTKCLRIWYFPVVVVLTRVLNRKMVELLTRDHADELITTPNFVVFFCRPR